MPKIQPAQTTFFLAGTAAQLNNKYVDTAQIASFVNRRLYEQGKVYFLEQIKCYIGANNDDNQAGVIFSTIPDTWVTRNAWVKAKALWKEMNLKVLEDNPSVQGKWANFKVFMDAAHYAGGTANTGPTLNLLPQDTGGNSILAGEWAISEFVRPQHEVDAATGLPLAADLFYGNMLGADNGSMAPGSALNSGGVIQAYEDTRAQVRVSPLVPAEMSTSWMTLLTDDGSQEPELADIIEAESDEAPYEMTDYVGGDANWTLPVPAAISLLSAFAPDDVLPGFALPLGMMKISATATGTDSSTATIAIKLVYAKGHYKGFACTEMRQ